MPTANPRTNVTLSPSLDLLVTRLAAVQNSSKSQVLRELLEAAEPALQRAVALMEAAADATSAVRDGLAKSLGDAQDRVEAQLAEHLLIADQATLDFVRVAEAVRGRRGQGGGRAAAAALAPTPKASTTRKRAKPPVPVTRGVGSPKGRHRGGV